MPHLAINMTRVSVLNGTMLAVIVLNGEPRRVAAGCGVPAEVGVVSLCRRAKQGQDGQYSQGRYDAFHGLSFHRRIMKTGFVGKS